MNQETEQTTQGVVKIRIDGIAACYYQNGVWQVVFICDETHRLNFYDQKELKRIPLAGAKNITIKAANSRAPRKPHTTEEEEALNFKKTFDMTAEYSHRKGIKSKHESEVKDCNCTLMTIENAFFYMAEQTDKKYDSVNEETGESFSLGYVANAVGAEIAVDAGSKLVIKADESNVKQYMIAGKEELRLFFDNNCYTGKCDTDSDFRMYYNHFQDAEKPDRRFKVKHSNGSVKTPGRTNCYPVVISKLVE